MNAILKIKCSHTKTVKLSFFVLFQFIFYIEVYLIHNVVLVSGTAK